MPSFGPVWAAGRSAPVGSPGAGAGPNIEGGPAKHPRSPSLSTHELLSGSYSTAKLVAAAALLRAAGWSEERIRREVYAPFIVAGPAGWSDSWGAPRYGPGPIVRQHQGQDVLCRYGAEVLAPEGGTVEFGTSVLGGRSARLFLPSGGYYYFAHFSEWNDRELSNGDEVRPGDVIGFCGDTGNATVPHVHVGWYGPDGVAIDPMQRLISWLRVAEVDLPALLTESALGAAGAATGTPGSAVPSLDIVRALLVDPLPEASFPARRTASTTGSRNALELTPVLVFLVLFGISGWRPAPEASRRRRLPVRVPTPTPTAWGDRRGPLLS